MEPNRRILVLGPPAVAVEGSIVAVSGRRVQSLLAALVLSVNHAIRIERLIEIVWPGGEPASGVNALQSHVSKLRSLLGEDAIVSTDHCYALVADCADVDACAFEHSVVGALDVMDAEPRRARSMLLEALSLWRGPAYAELADEDPFRIEAMRLEELRRTAVEAELACDVAVGDLVRAIGRLRSALADDPYREHLWLLLVRSLLGRKRRVDALCALADYSAAMAELGLAPSQEADALKSQILAGGGGDREMRGGVRAARPARR